MTTYEVELRRDESGAWIASVPDVPGCHSYGRSIEQAVNRIREALTLWVDDADDAELDPHPHLPARTRRRLDSALRARADAMDAERASADATVDVVTELAEMGFSRRDTAILVHLSPQRVQQLVDGGRGKEKKPSHEARPRARSRSSA